MSWYYAESNDRRGPVDDATFQSLVSAGTIKPETLVWSDGMAEWTPYGQLPASTAAAATVAAPAASPAGAGVARQACCECGGIFATDDMISYEGRYVCAGCKPLFFQKIREGASVSGEREYAGFWIRFVAKFVDGIIMNIVGRIIGLAVGVSGQGSTSAIFSAMGLSLVLNAIYIIYFTGKFGATPGKMACKLEVIRADGETMTFGRATGRYFAELLSSITLLIGYIMAAFDEEKRALHDRICDTRVVRKR
jgi:uncharacterized RDD family membrane protein YckC